MLAKRVAGNTETFIVTNFPTWWVG